MQIVFYKAKQSYVGIEQYDPKILDCERACCRELAPWVPKDKHLEQEYGAVYVGKTDSFLLLYQQPWATVKGVGVTLLS